MFEDVFSAVLPDESQYKIMKLHTDSGVVFSADVKSDPCLVWTLPDLLRSDKSYITSASFFGRKRQRRYVRHILGIVCDFDCEPGTTYEDILDRYYAARLPLPDVIVATATAGHYQAWNVFWEPLRANNDLILAKEYKIHEAMVKALGADPCAVGPERWVRRPYVDNIVYYDEYSRTSWKELCTWFLGQRPSPAPATPGKVVFIGTLLATPAGQRIQEAAAERGTRNAWAYGLGLCLFDAGILASDIYAKLQDWNKSLEEPLPVREIEKIYRSVMTSRHHASPRVLEAITGLSARVKGWYKWAKPRDRRRDHLQEIQEDIISDLLRVGTVTETQKAWAERLGVAYRTLKHVLAMLRDENIIVATVGHGRYATSSYVLSEAYLTSLYDQVAVGSDERILNGQPMGHTAISPLKGTVPLRPFIPAFKRVNNNKIRAESG